MRVRSASCTVASHVADSMTLILAQKVASEIRIIHYIEGSQRIKTIVDGPSGADAGVFGGLSMYSGRPGVGLLQATSNNLKWALNPTDSSAWTSVTLPAEVGILSA